MANIDLLQKVKAAVLASPDQWNQGHWAKKSECGTQLCVAGWACVISGEVIDWDRAYVSEEYPDLDSEDTRESGFLVTGEPIEERARELLDLGREADDLFWAFTNNEAMHILNDLIENG